MKPRKLAAYSAVFLLIAGCRGADEAPTEDPAGSDSEVAGNASSARPSEPPAGGVTPAAPETGYREEPAPGIDVESALTLRGWKGIRIGEPPGGAARDWGFADNGNYTDACRTWTSTASPGVALMVERLAGARTPVVTRITAYSPDAEDVHSLRGVQVGSSEQAVRAAYPKLEESPHKYAPPPAKDLFWRPDGSDTGLRFEIGPDGRVGELHAGIDPSLGYVEGCS
ncbi:hypothetical protein B5C34_14885 [Pacificimonas flava]|uniref:Lipoprotein n=2 Tax=Pacificimonas TaxID=1960290 RepID=A0A219B0W8_9SPHN|nr:MULTISPECIES: hypothetical protein [Pacificimonas]MBZ6379751.1 hypothetical protein [Pacificimonas aurantium]OWV31793.1 hypothetical protein B5C34_14885 [Pacificimonas flava]